jgi:hypothetical protein
LDRGLLLGLRCWTNFHVVYVIDVNYKSQSLMTYNLSLLGGDRESRVEVDAPDW